jgi:hypothetical protein
MSLLRREALVRYCQVHSLRSSSETRFEKLARGDLVARVEEHFRLHTVDQRSAVHAFVRVVRSRRCGDARA